MNLAVENIKFFARIFPLAMLGGTGCGAVTLKISQWNKISYGPLWKRAQVGINLSLISMTLYSSVRMLHIVTKNTAYSQIADIMIGLNVGLCVQDVLSVLRVNFNRNNLLKDKIKMTVQDFYPRMVSAFVGGVALATFEIIANTCLGYNLNNSDFAGSTKNLSELYNFISDRFFKSFDHSYICSLFYSKSNPLFL